MNPRVFNRHRPGHTAKLEAAPRSALFSEGNGEEAEELGWAEAAAQSAFVV